MMQLVSLQVSLLQEANLAAEKKQAIAAAELDLASRQRVGLQVMDAKG